VVGFRVLVGRLWVVLLAKAGMDENCGILRDSSLTVAELGEKIGKEVFRKNTHVAFDVVV
jgi:hypothetical protein